MCPTKQELIDYRAIYEFHHNKSRATILASTNLYKNDWSLLFQVIAKIESLDYKVVITNDETVIQFKLSGVSVITRQNVNKALENTYDAVLGFVSYYNTHIKPKPQSDKKIMLEFMCFGYCKEENAWEDASKCLPKIVGEYNDGNLYYESEALFDESWDWLIPVYEKLRPICEERNVNLGFYFDVKESYKQALKFIKAHNKR